jgi:hypothetical protein
MGEDRLYRTDSNGTDEFIPKEERLWVRTEHQSLIILLMLTMQ